MHAPALFTNQDLKMRTKILLTFVVFGILVAGAQLETAETKPCRPVQSSGMLTGPVYDSIEAECNWIDALNRRDAAAAAQVLGATFFQVDPAGIMRSRAALLGNVADGVFGQITLTSVNVPFSASSTNIVVSMWTYHRTAHRVTDVFFCDVFRSCRYQLIAELIAVIARGSNSQPSTPSIPIKR